MQMATAVLADDALLHTVVDIGIASAAFHSCHFPFLYPSSSTCDAETVVSVVVAAAVVVVVDESNVSTPFCASNLQPDRPVYVVDFLFFCSSNYCRK